MVENIYGDLSISDDSLSTDVFSNARVQVYQQKEKVATVQTSNSALDKPSDSSTTTSSSSIPEKAIDSSESATSSDNLESWCSTCSGNTGKDQSEESLDDSVCNTRHNEKVVQSSCSSCKTDSAGGSGDFMLTSSKPSCSSHTSATDGDSSHSTCRLLDTPKIKVDWISDYYFKEDSSHSTHRVTQPDIAVGWLPNSDKSIHESTKKEDSSGLWLDSLSSIADSTQSTQSTHSSNKTKRPDKTEPSSAESKSNKLSDLDQLFSWQSSDSSSTSKTKSSKSSSTKKQRSSAASEATPSSKWMMTSCSSTSTQSPSFIKSEELYSHKVKWIPVHNSVENLEKKLQQMSSNSFDSDNFSTKKNKSIASTSSTSSRTLKQSQSSLKVSKHGVHIRFKTRPKLPPQFKTMDYVKSIPPPSPRDEHHSAVRPSDIITSNVDTFVDSDDTGSGLPLPQFKSAYKFDKFRFEYPQRVKHYSCGTFFGSFNLEDMLKYRIEENILRKNQEKNLGV